MRGEQARWLAVRTEDGSTQLRQFTAQECARMCEGQGRGRSISPSKRQRSAAGDECADEIGVPDVLAGRCDSVVLELTAEGSQESVEDEYRQGEEGYEEYRAIQVEGCEDGDEDKNERGRFCKTRRNEIFWEEKAEIVEQEQRRAKRVREWEEELAEGEQEDRTGKASGQGALPDWAVSRRCLTDHDAERGRKRLRS